MERRTFLGYTAAASAALVMAGTREGAMAILIGIAARKSIELKRPVKITELTDLVPMARRF